MQKTILIIVILGISFSENLNAQIFTHAESYEGVGSATNLVVDVVGNTIFSGELYANDTLRLGTFDLVSNGSRDAFVAKRNPQGDILWAHSYGGSKMDWVKGLAVDALGNVYVSGTVQDSAIIFGVPVTTNYPGLNTGQHVAYVMKLNPFGNLEWLQTFQQTFTPGAYGYTGAWDLTVGPHGDLYLNGRIKGILQLGNTNINTNGLGHAFLAKLSTIDGTFEWAQSFNTDGINPQDITTGNDGYIYALYSFLHYIDAGGINVPAHVFGQTSGERLLVKWDTLGNYQWAKHLYTDVSPPSTFLGIFDCQISACGPNGVALAWGFMGLGYIDSQLVTSPIVGAEPRGEVVRFDGAGNMFWSNSWADAWYIDGFTGNESGEILLSGRASIPSNSIQFNGGFTMTLSNGWDRFIVKFNAAGQVVWGNSIEGNFSSFINYFKIEPIQFGINDKINVAGYSQWDSIRVGNDTLLLKKGPQDVLFFEIQDTLLPPPPVPNSITGKVFRDDNLNCQLDSGEAPLSQILVQAAPGPHLGITDSAGNYEIKVPAGIYTVSQIIPNIPGLVMDTVCPPLSSYQASFTAGGQSVTDYDFGDTLTHCPYLEINIISARKRLCAESNTRIEYVNRGTDTARNAFLRLEFDPFLIPTSASLPWQVIDSVHWEIQLGDIAPDSLGSVNISENIPCNILAMGLAPCIRAEIFPSNRCDLPDPNWSQAELSLKSNCLVRDTVQFTISNSGEGNMLDSVRWDLYLDAVLVDTGMVKIDTGQEVILIVPTNGQTAYLRMDQVAYYPDETWLASTKEACGLGEPGLGVSKGFVSQFPLVDWRKRTEKVSCLEIVNSYDPNDKQANPKGITASNVIPPDTRISYQIRFQNTGTDTAFKVVVRDTLPNAIDLSTFVFEGASHSHQYAIEGGNPAILICTFDPIILPDSNANVEASQGYFNFSVNVDSNIALGTVLENRAAIYFDFNPPVITNTVMHTVDTFEIEAIQNNLVLSYGPIRATIMENAVFCQTDSIEISALSPLQGQGVWSFLEGNGILSDSAAEQTWLIGADTGKYALKWKVSDGPLSASDSVIFDIYPIPEQPEIIKNQANLVADSDANFFKWFLNAVPLSDSSKTIYPTSSGSYSVQAFYNENCPSPFSHPVEWISVGVDEDLEYQMEVFPNPNNGLFEVDLPNIQISSRLYVYGLAGNEVWHSSILPLGESERHEILLDNLAEGLYYLRLEPQNIGTLIQIVKP